ncbi:hypothetical protein HPULCUR_004329 [Helicostylum pulchrum]|uniref:Uncharacterized protein n=1 Tax=Helicostylum pulchrum TaxID=562976 RepID=A0ABP9XVX4_9FUNG
MKGFSILGYIPEYSAELSRIEQFLKAREQQQQKEFFQGLRKEDVMNSISQGNFESLLNGVSKARSISEDEESDDMGTAKTTSNKKTTTKKKKRNITKQEEAGE